MTKDIAMGVWSNRVEDYNSSDRYGHKHDHDSEFRGPIKNRSCTDIICLLLFVAFLLGWIALGIYAFTKGNPQRLVFPSNSRGEICGRGAFKYVMLPILFILAGLAYLRSEVTDFLPWKRYHGPVKTLNIRNVEG